MDEFTKQNWREMPKSKLFFIGAAILFGVAIFLTIIRTVLFNIGGGSDMAYRGGGISNLAVESTIDMEMPSFASKMSMDKVALPGAPVYEESGGAIGGDAENYETLTYYVNFKKSGIDNICNEIKSLKKLNYVVFEDSSNNDTSCSYSFKVERNHVDDVVNLLNKFEPNDFTANMDVVKKQLVEYDSQLNILLKRQNELKKTLDDAILAYDNLITLATNVEDTESLTKIINSKLAMIDKLTNQRFALAAKIDSISKRSAELRDKIEYAYFHVSVSKYRIFDFDGLKDSWVNQVRTFVYNFNAMLQSLSIGIFSLFLSLFQIVVYVSIVAFIALAFVKYGWKFVKRFWNS